MRARLLPLSVFVLSGLILAACGGGLRNNQESASVAGTAPGASSGMSAELKEAGPLGDVSFGRDDAPVTVIEYASLTCPYCRQFHMTTYPRFKKELIDTGKVRYIIREFPIGRTAGTAAIVARCAPRDQYMALYEKFLAQQSKWVSQEVRKDIIYEIAAQTGMSRAAFDNCMANQMIIDGLNWVKQRGRQLGVVGTPTFFVNGKKASGALTFEQIKALIEPQSS